MDRQADEQQNAYKEEAGELLTELESALLKLEEMPDNEDLIGRVFRAMHTIKGSGAMFGFDAVAAFTHEIETVYDLVRDGKMIVTKELIDLSLSSRDLIADMLADPDGGLTIDPARAKTIIGALRGLIPSRSETPGAAPDAIKSDRVAPEETERAVTYRIRFHPVKDIFASGTNPILLIQELSELGESHIMAHTAAVPRLDEMEPDACYVFWDILLTTDRGINAIKDVFIFVEDSCTLSIQVIDEQGDDAEAGNYKKLGEILVERGDLAAGDIGRIVDNRKLIGEMLVEARVVSAGAVESALAEQEHVKKIRQKRQEDTRVSSIRVDADRLDGLVDLVGELVTMQARLGERAAEAGDGKLILIAEEVARLVGDLRDNTMKIRMLPIGSTFSKFKRLVRDLSDSLGKEVVMTTEGGDTELDKSVIEQLNDPLVHLIRNSIDHGIEAPGARVKAGKPAQGKVQLKAAHVGANVFIDIIDDGWGLDAQVIRQHALEKGLIAPEAKLSEKEIFSLIFEPGFSTTRAVTSVSGRGVGMDVVKRGIEKLKGTIEISTRKGIGTTITLKLPLTLAIIDGFMVKIGDGYFVFPLTTVVECVEMTRAEVIKVRATNMMNIRGAIVPYQSLRDTFDINGTPPAIEKIVIAESCGRAVGFGVDGVIGQHQTVIKSLGKFYKDTKGISGATILGDGTLALILDIVELINVAEWQP